MRVSVRAIVSYIIFGAHLVELSASTECGPSWRPVPAKVWLYTSCLTLPDESLPTGFTECTANIYWTVSNISAWKAPDKRFEIQCHDEQDIWITANNETEFYVSYKKQYAFVDITQHMISEKLGDLTCRVRAVDYFGESSRTTSSRSLAMGLNSTQQSAPLLLISAQDNRGKFGVYRYNPDVGFTAHSIWPARFPQAIDYWKEVNQETSLERLNKVLFTSGDYNISRIYLRYNFTELEDLRDYQNYLPQNRNNRLVPLFAVSSVTVDWINRYHYVAGIEPNSSHFKNTTQSVLAAWRTRDETLYRTPPGSVIEQIVFCPIANRLYFSQRNLISSTITLHTYDIDGNDRANPMFDTENASCNCTTIFSNNLATVSPAIGLDWRQKAYALGQFKAEPFHILWSTTSTVWSSDPAGCLCERVYSNPTINGFSTISIGLDDRLYWSSNLDNGNNKLHIVDLTTGSTECSSDWNLTDIDTGEAIRFVKIYDFALYDPVYRSLPANLAHCYTLTSVAATVELQKISDTWAMLRVPRPYIKKECPTVAPYVIQLYYRKVDSEDKSTCDAKDSKSCKYLESLSSVFTLENLTSNTKYALQVQLVGWIGRTTLSKPIIFETKPTLMALYTKIVILTGVTTLVAIIVITVVLLLAQEHRRRVLEKNRRKKIRHYVGPSHLRYISTKFITSIRFLSRGHFGAVYEGIMYNTCTHRTRSVALKILQNSSTDNMEMEFYREAVIMAQLNHNTGTTENSQHVVQLLGVCIDGPQPMLVMELMSGGSLSTYLSDYATGLMSYPLTVSLVIKMCIQIAKGMQFLHEQRIILRDLRADNVLRTRKDSDSLLKIADFGLARSLDNTEVYVPSGDSEIPFRYTAPEVFNMFQPSGSKRYGVTPMKADVWSFGVTMWEAFSPGMYPYAELATVGEVKHHLVEQESNLGQPRDCPDAVFEIMLRCWQRDPNQRPNFRELVQQLRFVHRMLNAGLVKDYVLRSSAYNCNDDTTTQSHHSWKVPVEGDYINGKWQAKIWMNNALDACFQAYRCITAGVKYCRNETHTKHAMKPKLVEKEENYLNLWVNPDLERFLEPESNQVTCNTKDTHLLLERPKSDPDRLSSGVYTQPHYANKPLTKTISY